MTILLDPGEEAGTSSSGISGTDGGTGAGAI